MNKLHEKLFWMRTGFLGLNILLMLYCFLVGRHYNMLLVCYFIFLMILLVTLTYLEWSKQKKELLNDMSFHVLSFISHFTLFFVLVRTIFDSNILSTYVLESQGIETHGVNVLYLNSNLLYLSTLFMLLIVYGCIKGKTKKA